MNLKRSPFSILDKDRREIDYIKEIYKKKFNLKSNPTNIQTIKMREIQKAQDILMLDKISI